MTKSRKTECYCRTNGIDPIKLVKDQNRINNITMDDEKKLEIAVIVLVGIMFILAIAQMIQYIMFLVIIDDIAGF